MYCYFIQAVNGGPVKIGKADRPDRRLAQLQAANPTELVIRAICLGGNFAERELHLRFANQRLSGEWFDLTPELQTLIDSLPSWDQVRDGAECPEIVKSNIAILLKLYDLGYSFADIAELLEVTRQRAHQIVQDHRPNRSKRPFQMIDGYPVRGPRPKRPPRPDEPIADAYRRLSSSVEG